MPIRSDVRSMIRVYKLDIAKSKSNNNLSKQRQIDVTKLEVLINNIYSDNVTYNEFVKFKKALTFKFSSWLPYLLFLPYSRLVTHIDKIIHDYSKDELIGDLKKEISKRDETIYESVEQGKIQVEAVTKKIEQKFAKELIQQKSEIKDLKTIVERVSAENIQLKIIVKESNSKLESVNKKEFDDLKRLVLELSGQMKDVLSENKSLRDELEGVKKASNTVSSS